MVHNSKRTHWHRNYKKKLKKKNSHTNLNENTYPSLFGALFSKRVGIELIRTKGHVPRKNMGKIQKDRYTDVIWYIIRPQFVFAVVYYGVFYDW